MSTPLLHLPQFLEVESDTHYIRLTGHRVGLAEVARLYKQGESPESIAIQDPSVPLAQIHKVIAFYLENEASVEAYVEEDDEALSQMETAARMNHPSPTMVELRRRPLHPRMTLTPAILGR